MEHFEIGQEVAFDMNCPCGDPECDGQDQGYMIHIINGAEDNDFLQRCYVFDSETMNKLR